MPASLFPEMERNGGGLEDQRALQLALELSMLGLNNENNTIHPNDSDHTRSKKSQNTTECVPVPSSEHVAEIVGRQGCKIKALRAKTNTYIKTPVRGEEPVFVVTGRKEDVCAAKREILSAAEHFSQIRAQRKNNQNGALAPGPNSNIPGQTTIQVRVPYRVVGLVVGPKGATIKRIQQQTNTYIVTPSRDKEPVFEVTGLPENVESAQKEIEAHIAVRTGGILDSNDDNYLEYNGVDQSYTGNLTNGFVTSLFKSDLNGFVSHSRDGKTLLSQNSQESIFSFSSNGSAKLTDFCPFTGTFPNGFGLYEADEGIGDSPTFDPMIISSPPTWPDLGLYPSSSLPRQNGSLGSAGAALTQAITDSLLMDHSPAQRIQSDPLSLPSFSTLSNVTTTASINGPFINSSGSLASSPTDSIGSVGKSCRRECIVCFESDVVAALVPCGHNLFCLECASRICEKTEAECPICHQKVSQAIRIYS
ncbi:RNA-binding protein MEX3B-like [Limulus polyphemus]|uniref:RNA-binding protein MEX3B-like n=1 Tax=Limulus polyphemus TaxID=6850 RepID=A0ABM1B9K7_LIMPO|nr:RNA-binding protein MEX3B-like [Limulus polyphemus]